MKNLNLNEIGQVAGGDSEQAVPSGFEKDISVSEQIESNIRENCDLLKGVDFEKWAKLCPAESKYTNTDDSWWSKYKGYFFGVVAAVVVVYSCCYSGGAGGGHRLGSE